MPNGDKKNPLNPIDAFQAGQKGFTDAVRKRVFDTQRADVYPDPTNIGTFTRDIAKRASNFITGKTVREQEEEAGSGRIDEFSDAAFRQYMSQPGTGIVRPSEFRPPEAKEGEEFFTFEDTVTGRGIKDDLVNLIRREGRDVRIGGESDLGSTGFALGHFTPKRGKDERGEFISIQDRYDFDINDKDINKFIPKDIADRVLGGKPFNVYDKVYIDEALEGLDEEKAKVWGAF
jgi:hypothetical protein